MRRKQVEEKCNGYLEEKKYFLNFIELLLFQGNDRLDCAKQY